MSELSDPDTDWRVLPRRATFWFRIALVFACASLIGQVVVFVASLSAPRPPTIHTRRITVGDRSVSIEIPDGQCATALGVTICVPDHPPRKVSP